MFGNYTAPARSFMIIGHVANCCEGPINIYHVACVAVLYRVRSHLQREKQCYEGDLNPRKMFT